MPSTTLVEADVSLINWTRDPQFKVVINRLLLGINFALQTIQDLGGPVYLVVSPLMERK
jgi:hypothetical protein